jgi:hypothetical protein
LSLVLHVPDDRDASTEFLVDHKTEDAHHGRAAVVEFDGAFRHLSFGVEGVPTEIQRAVPEISDEFVSGSLDVLHDDSYPNGIAAVIGDNAIPGEGLAQIVAFVGALELFVMKDIEGTGNEFVGDFRNGALDFGWDTFDAETQMSKRAIELNNGRAAMMGILGLMVHEELGGSIPIVGDM